MIMGLSSECIVERETSSKISPFLELPLRVSR